MPVVGRVRPAVTLPVRGLNAEVPPREEAVEVPSAFNWLPLMASVEVAEIVPTATFESVTGVALPAPVPTSVMVLEGIRPFGVTESRAVVYCTGALVCRAAMAAPTLVCAIPATGKDGVLRVPFGLTIVVPPRAVATEA